MVTEGKRYYCPNIMFYVGFRLAYLELTLTYSKGQLGRRNGVRQIFWSSFIYLNQMFQQTLNSEINAEIITIVVLTVLNPIFSYY